MVKAVRYRRPMPNDTGRARSERIAHTRAAQRFINCKNCADNLELLLWANFDSKAAYFVTFTYRDEALPDSRKAAKKAISSFFTIMRNEKKRSGQELKYIYATEGSPLFPAQNEAGEWEICPWKVKERWSAITENQSEKAETRLHHHAVMLLDKSDYETVRALWSHGTVYITPVKRGNTDTFQRLSYYMTKEYRAGETENGERAYTPSLNLEKPERAGKWVEEYEDISAPLGATIIRNTTDETAYSAYHQLCYILPPPSVSPKDHRCKRPKEAAHRII